MLRRKGIKSYGSGAKFPRFRVYLTFFVLLVLLGLFALEKRLEPALIAMAEARAKQVAVETINQAILDQIVEKVKYEDLIYIHKDKEDRPVLLQPNVVKIEKMQAETMLAVNEKLTELSRSQFGIPLGQLLGSKVFAAQGPEINIRMLPVGVVDVELQNSFESAGINQTRHSLSFKIKAELQIVAPFLDSKVKTVTDILVAENILLGQVPSHWWNLSLGGFNR